MELALYCFVYFNSLVWAYDSFGVSKSIIFDASPNKTIALFAFREQPRIAADATMSSGGSPSTVASAASTAAIGNHLFITRLQ